MPRYNKCSDCGSEISELMVEGGFMKRGLKKNDEALTNKLAAINDAKTREDILEEQRRQEKAKKLEKLKQKDPLKRAFHALIRHIREKNLSEYELFQEIDQDGDGSLTRMEMSAALRRLGVQLLPVELDAVLRIFDGDGNHEIDFAEFYQALKDEMDNVEGVCDSGPDPRLCGFGLGQRVRMKCTLFTDLTKRGKNIMENVSDAAAGKVMGPGTSPGLLLVVFDASGEPMNVKAKSLEPWEAPEQHPPLCMCPRCYEEFCKLEGEDDDSLPWCS
eukprot:TRINITY_DN8967_c0_g2_i2.p1 TRINITY_DN8967_c0_g2~~TRINITY_DN8967_c0_g2_i2.p1  ORF type:complete len:305 (-),score=65.19 TRINITY_DN8967_c0_g2_i2:168-989(-)